MVNTEKEKEVIELSPIITKIEVEGLNETIEKLEKIKSLMCEINDLSKKLFK